MNGLRASHPGTIDQDLPEFVIADNGQPIGTVQDGDSVMFYNFRGHRAIEITRAFVEQDFNRFDRVRAPQVTFAGMLQYNGELQLPKRFLVTPPAIRDTSGEWFSKAGLGQFACTETQKFGHVTYFWSGNRSNKFECETWQKVPGDVVPFEQRPWMKSAEITDDHGNADEMYELDKKTRQPSLNVDGTYKAKTVNTLNPVPLILFDKISGGKLA